jgi:hypothetical protein
MYKIITLFLDAVLDLLRCLLLYVDVDRIQVTQQIMSIN